MKINRLRVPILAVGVLCFVCSAGAVPLGSDSLEDARTEVYRSVNGTELKAYIFEPAERDELPRPAIVFFFGGGWRSGNPNQFAPHCRYLASRGMVAMTVDYRVASRHGVKAVDCVRDAKAAIAWVHANAERLHIDPKRIAAGGGSAGGHLAACTAFLDEIDVDNDEDTPTLRPSALVLFNPVLVLAPLGLLDFDANRIERLNERLGVEPERLSPAHHITTGAPPTVIFHGTEDETVPFSTIEAFEKHMAEASNPCTVHAYEGEGHGFFNYRRSSENFVKTVEDMDKFLVSLGWIEGEPTVEKLLAADGVE